MRIGGIYMREAEPADLPGIFYVRTSVRENLLTRTELDARGITDESVAASLKLDAKGWVADEEGRIVAFSIADQASRSIFALFVLPSHEGRGLGKRLLGLALQWLWDNGAERVWLDTGKGTRAASFYERQGWICVGPAPNDSLRFERRRPQLLRF